MRARSEEPPAAASRGRTPAWLAIALAALLLSSAELAAQGLALCSGNSYVAYVSWTGDGNGRAAVVSLTELLFPDSETEIDLPDGVVSLACGSKGPELTSVPATEAAALPVRIEPGSRRPLLFTCDEHGVGGPALDRVRQHPVGPLVDRFRGGDDGDARVYALTSARWARAAGGWRLRVELRERVTDRVERELLIFEADCPRPDRE